MYNILTLNKIAAIGTSRLGDNYKYGDDVQNPDAVLVRSAAMHDMEFADNLLAIARAGAGTNNIPKDKCSEHLEQKDGALCPARLHRHCPYRHKRPETAAAIRL